MGRAIEDVTVTSYIQKSLNFLQARFEHSSMEEIIKSFFKFLWRSHCQTVATFLSDERVHILKLVQPAVYFYTKLLDVCGSNDTK